MNNDVSIIVMSCDKNKWLNELFYEQLMRNWPTCPYPIYFVMEIEKMEFPNVKCISFGEKSFSWCKRLRRALEKIDTEYVLFMLDDFLIESIVNEELLKKYLCMMQEYDLYNIILTPINNERNYVESKFDHMIFRHRFGRYKVSLQCGIWKNEIFRYLINEKENAWEFEIFSNIRSFVLPDKFYAVKALEDKPIDYNDGFFMVQGKVNEAEKKRIEKKIGKKIEVDENLVTNIVVRDNIRFIQRVIRRLKIMLWCVIYFIRFLIFGEDKYQTI